MTRRTACIGLAALAFAFRPQPSRAAEGEIHHTDAEWRRLLPPASYAVLREEGTELAFSSPLDAETRPGLYSCMACDLALYSSKTKYDSGSGWPSFWAPLPHAVATKNDYDIGVLRTEVHCRRCLSHLGHVFDDGPRPTGLRYCMNGVALRFAPGRTAPAT